MKRRLLTGFLVLVFGALLLPSPALAEEEEISLTIFNRQPYDLLLESEKFSGCGEEDAFILAPDDIPFDSNARISWLGGCDVRLVWSIRHFTGLTIRLTFEAETGEMKVRSQSNEFFPVLSGPFCEEGVCVYKLLIFNASPWFG